MSIFWKNDKLRESTDPWCNTMLKINEDAVKRATYGKELLLHSKGDYAVVSVIGEPRVRQAVWARRDSVTYRWREIMDYRHPTSQRVIVDVKVKSISGIPMNDKDMSFEMSKDEFRTLFSYHMLQNLNHILLKIKRISHSEEKPWYEISKFCDTHHP